MIPEHDGDGANDLGIDVGGGHVLKALLGVEAVGLNHAKELTILHHSLSIMT